MLHSVNNYKDYDFGRQYTAIVYKLSIPRGDFFVNGIDGVNVDGQTNDNVQAIHIVHQTTKFLPRRVLDFYKNVNHYHVVDSGLETLVGEPLDRRIRYVHFDDNRIRTIPREFFQNTVDMQLISIERNLLTILDAEMFRGMPALRWVSFAGNRIRTLPGTLFSANVNLECLSFENNGLTTVGGDLVKSLTKLKGVSFDGNTCINVAYWNEPSMRAELTTEFTTNCAGRCTNMDAPQKEIDNMNDIVDQMEDKKPECSWSKWGTLNGNKNGDRHHYSHSDSSESNENDIEKKQLHYGPNHACPHAHYPKKA